MIPDPALEVSPAERADAARNRRRALAAAADLVAERGVAAVTMEDVAAAAGVGRMTLYRRFGDKGGLGRALLGEHEAALQQQVLSGPPPLGPGAPARDRLAAFVAAYVRFCAEHLDLVRLAEDADPPRRYDRGVYRLWHTHVRLLLTDAGAPDADARADVILAGLLGHVVGHRVRAADGRVEDVAATLSRAAVALASAAD